MRSIALGSTFVALAIVACSSFDGAAPNALVEEAGVEEAGVDAAVSDAPDVFDAPALDGKHVVKKWIDGYGSTNASDVPVSIAWSAGNLFVSTTMGADAVLFAPAMGGGGVQAYQGALVAKLHDDGTFGGSIYNFVGSGDATFAAGPITASGGGVFASTTRNMGTNNHDVDLRRLVADTMVENTNSVHVTVFNAGDQVAAAATNDGLDGAVFALAVTGTTSLSNTSLSSDGTDGKAGIVTAFGSSSAKTYFHVDSNVTAKPAAVSLDASGRVVIAGWYEGKSADAMGGFGSSPMADGEDGFVARSARDGTLVDYVYFGGRNTQHITSLATQLGDRFVAGTFTGFIKGGSVASAPTLTVDGTHAFAAKVDDANVVAWLVDLGPVSAPFVGLAVDKTGVFVTGTFEGTTQIGNDKLVSLGATDMFVASLELATGRILAADGFGRENAEIVTAFTTDRSGSFFLAGTFEKSTSLDGTTSIVAQGSTGTDALVLAFTY